MWWCPIYIGRAGSLNPTQLKFEVPTPRVLKDVTWHSTPAAGATYRETDDRYACARYPRSRAANMRHFAGALQVHRGSHAAGRVSAIILCTSPRFPPLFLLSRLVAVVVVAGKGAAAASSSFGSARPAAPAAGPRRRRPRRARRPRRRRRAVVSRVSAAVARRRRRRRAAAAAAASSSASSRLCCSSSCIASRGRPGVGGTSPWRSAPPRAARSARGTTGARAGAASSAPRSGARLARGLAARPADGSSVGPADGRNDGSALGAVVGHAPVGALGVARPSAGRRARRGRRACGRRDARRGRRGRRVAGLRVGAATARASASGTRSAGRP